MKTNTELIILTGTYIVLSNNSWLPIFLYLNESCYQMFLRTNLFNGNHVFHMLILVTLKKMGNCLGSELGYSTHSFLGFEEGSDQITFLYGFPISAGYI